MKDIIEHYTLSLSFFYYTNRDYATLLLNG